MNYHSLNERFINIQAMNLYKMKFSLNRNYLYRDMKDFNGFLERFNFIRYFHSISHFSRFEGQTYCERLIKTLEWRTEETKQYLLLLIRTHPWERFLIGVEDFVVAFEEVYLAAGEKWFLAMFIFSYDLKYSRGSRIFGFFMDRDKGNFSTSGNSFILRFAMFLGINKNKTLEKWHWNIMTNFFWDLAIIFSLTQNSRNQVKSLILVAKNS